MGQWPITDLSVSDDVYLALVCLGLGDEVAFVALARTSYH